MKKNPPASPDLRPVAAAAGLLALGPYLLTMNRTFGVVDYGELAACAYTLGIPHPTGYPTIMTLGYVATHLSPLTPILTLNILAAVLTACSVAALTYLYHHILTAFFPRTSRPERHLMLPYYAGLIALFTGLTDMWWEQAVGFEVYCLHALMLPVVIWLFLRYVEQEREREIAGKKRGPIGFTRAGALFAFTLGISFTNHMTTGLLGPAFLVYYFWSLLPASPERASGHRSSAAWLRAFRRWLYLAPPFLLGLVPPYLWMMIRSGMNPPFNWGAPSTPATLWYHIAGRDYSQAMGHILDKQFWQQIQYFSNTIPPAVGYLGLATGIAGILVMARRSPRLLTMSVLIFILSVLYACGYDVNDIGNYFMGPVLMITVWSAVAVGYIHERFGPRAGMPVAVALVLATGAANYGDNNERGNTITEDFTYNMLNSLPQNAIVLTKQWDFWEAGSYYMQEVSGFRRDVTVIDVELLHTDWYVDQVERAHPGVMGLVREEAAAFKAQAVRQRTGALRSSADTNAYVDAFGAMINGLIDRNISAQHPCFTTFDPFDREIAPNYYRVPYHLALRLVPDTAYLAAEFPQYRFSMWRAHIVPQSVWTLKLYALACLNRALYEQESGHPDLAIRYARLGVSFDPGFREQDVPDFPVHIERQVMEDLRQFRKAKADLEKGTLPVWH